MTSNVYLASGIAAHLHVMKIGKANTIRQREGQIRIAIEYVCECAAPHEAFALEWQLRQKMRKLGAVRVGRHIDWFIYDAALYEQVKAYLYEVAGDRVKLREFVDDVEDTEIRELRKRYFQLIRESAVRTSQVEPRPKIDPVVSKLEAEKSELEILIARQRASSEQRISELETQLHDIEIEKAQLIASLETELRLYREGRIKPPKP